MQKPDDSNDPHPLYQPMKPDLQDYDNALPDKGTKLESNKHEMRESKEMKEMQAFLDKSPNQYPPTLLPTPPTSAAKKSWFSRLSRRTKIIAGVIILIVIFVAAFVPAYITTRQAHTATPPVMANFTAAGLPINNATYRISISGGRNGCNQYLSCISCSGGNLVDMYSGDDDSGRQHWVFRLVQGKTNVYNIIVGGGRDGCNTFLTGTACPSTLATLFGGDDQTGLQQWLANPIPNTTNEFNLMIPQGRATCDQYLSTQNCNNGSNLVDIYSFDDGSGRQRWVLTRIA